MLMWQKIWTYVLGLDPPAFNFVSAVPAIIVFYSTAFLICFSIYTFVQKFVPRPFKEYASDYVQALTFCTFPFGHGIVRHYFGQTGYMLVMVPLISVTCELMPVGLGNPVSVWLEYTRGERSLPKCIIKIWMCVLGGWSAFRLGMLIFAIELNPYYVSTVRDPHCASDLNVPMYSGLVIEFIGSLYDTWLCLQLLSKNRVIDNALKCVNGGILVGFGVNLTGMYMHPAMATGHTFGCGKTPVFTHVLVYWIAPMAAASLAVKLDRRFHLDLFPRLVKPQVPVVLPETVHHKKKYWFLDSRKADHSHEHGFMHKKGHKESMKVLKTHGHPVNTANKARVRERHPSSHGTSSGPAFRPRSKSWGSHSNEKVTSIRDLVKPSVKNTGKHRK